MPEAASAPATVGDSEFDRDTAVTRRAPGVYDIDLSAGWTILGAVNATVVVILFVLEHEWGFHFESSQLIRYERIELIKPEHHCALLEDLRQRTGLPINRVEIGRLNFLNDSAELRIFFDEPGSRRHFMQYDIGQPDD